MTVVGLFGSSTSVLTFVGADGRAVVRPAASFVRPTEPSPGTRRAVWRDNDADYVQVLADAAAARSIVVSVNTRASSAEAAELVTRTGATRVDTDRATWSGHAEAQPFAALPPHGPHPDDPFVVFTTSGTTARPKLVLHTQGSIARHARAVAARFGYAADSVVMVALPLCGTFGLASLTAALAANSSVVVLARFEPGLASQLVERYRVSTMNGTDDMFHRMLETGADLSTIRLGGYARFNSSLDGIVERAAVRGMTLTGLYGMSEVQALFSLRDPSGSPAERSRAGGTIAAAEATARVVDPGSGAGCEPGDEGELQLRGPGHFAGYLAEGGAAIDHDLTAAAFDRGWFRTGDLARMEDERTFTYLARIGDVLRLGGFLVAPAEIESSILKVSGVTGAQVVSVDLPRGSRPVAFVTGAASPTAVIDHCRHHLAGYKVPIRVVRIDAFPTTVSANGTKIQREALRRRAQHLIGTA